MCMGEVGCSLHPTQGGAASASFPSRSLLLVRRSKGAQGGQGAVAGDGEETPFPTAW